MDLDSRHFSKCKSSRLIVSFFSSQILKFRTMKRADQDSSKEVIRVMMVDDDDLNNMIHKILFKKAKVTSEL